jgi:hypothetical protein
MEYHTVQNNKGQFARFGLIERISPEISHCFLFVPPMTNSNLFKTNANLMVTSHRVESAVTLDNIQSFGSALEDKRTEYNDRNFACISTLSKQFNFRVVSAKPLSTLLARVNQHENQFAPMLRLTCHPHLRI